MLEVIGALSGVDQVEISAQRTVLREIGDLFNFLQNNPFGCLEFFAVSNFGFRAERLLKIL